MKINFGVKFATRHFHQMEIYTDMVPISAFKGTLKQHVKSFKCDQCPSTFSRKINLINHKVQQHQIHLVCEAVFGTNYALNRHIETLHQSCDQCPLTFATRENLRRHIKSVHEGRKKYECVL